MTLGSDQRNGTDTLRVAEAVPHPERPTNLAYLSRQATTASTVSDGQVFSSWHQLVFRDDTSGGVRPRRTTGLRGACWFSSGEAMTTGARGQGGWCALSAPPGVEPGNHCCYGGGRPSGLASRCREVVRLTTFRDGLLACAREVRWAGLRYGLALVKTLPNGEVHLGRCPAISPSGVWGGELPGRPDENVYRRLSRLGVLAVEYPPIH
ncbi:hypothetical protein SAMN04488548_1341130 [Gordonia westfalica]|uniref:Uncharacterized protein n=1 Tax=Gordonia westfalica TaxID=158898 RepID=A0A1H2IGI5_9ACTN|nr:hypothetical protein SAMN04488548_1341130 [Gordonia westfalica]